MSDISKLPKWAQAKFEELECAKRLAAIDKLIEKHAVKWRYDK